VWYKTPEQAVQYPYHFIAHVLTYGACEDVAALDKYITPEQLVEAIDNAPAGGYDPRLWVYWNARIGRYPTPPMPVRTFT